MLNKFYQYVRALSLDVVAGATISARWIGNYFEVDIPKEAILSLGISVWLIYTLDHLLDAQKIRPKHAAHRHFIHHKNAPLIFTMLVLMSAVLIYLVQYLSVQLLWTGLLLGLVVVIYLFFVHKRKTPFWGKEWFIAVVYASGICLPTISHLGYIPLDLAYFWIQFFVLAGINLLIFNMFEYKTDKKFGFNSFATIKGHNLTRQIILLLLALFIIIWLLGFEWIEGKSFLDYQAILIFMGSVLAMVLSKEKLLKEEEWYRVIGDIVFIFPLIDLLFSSS